jgi:NAD(P)H dehydrogenase (quinone)
VKLLLLLAAAAVAAAQPTPTRVLIAYHSESGNTAKLAQAIQAGAASVEGVEAALRKAADVQDADIGAADGIVVGTPVQWGDLSAETKRLLDRIGKVLDRPAAGKRTLGEGRTAGAFCTGGGVSMGKEMARLAILSAFLTMRFVVIGGVDAEGFGTLGPDATTGPADPGVSKQEVEEARQFGARFAQLTRRVRR